MSRSKLEVVTILIIEDADSWKDLNDKAFWGREGSSLVVNTCKLDMSENPESHYKREKEVEMKRKTHMICIQIPYVKELHPSR